MERWGTPLAACILLVPLSGCFGGDAPTAAPEAVEEADTNVSRDVLPGGRDGTLAAFDETNATEAGAGGLDHHHDYWEGRERVTLIEGDHALRTPLKAEGGAAADLRMPVDALVYEGTGAIELLFSDPQLRACAPGLYVNGQSPCGDAARVDHPEGGPDGVRVMLKHAATTTWVEVGEIVWGEPMRYEIGAPEETDMPHARTTLWAFRLESDDKADSMVVFTARIDAIRSVGEIPLWPGHPDLYAAGHTRVVHAASVVTREDGLSGAAGAYVGGVGEAMVPAVPDKLISYGTRTLHIWANITDVKQANPAEKASGWFLQYHNASGSLRSTNLSDANHTGDVTTHLWVLEVHEDGMDSPYADGSRWGFLLRGSFSAGVVACSGCANYEVAYDLTIHASDLPAEVYHAKA